MTSSGQERTVRVVRPYGAHGEEPVPGSAAELASDGELAREGKPSQEGRHAEESVSMGEGGLVVEGEPMDECELQRLCFELIAHVGEAKSCYMEALGFAREGRFVEAHEAVQRGSAAFAAGHLVHVGLVSQEAAGTGVPATLLLIHAEAQLMDAESCKACTQEFIGLHERIRCVRA